MDQSRAIYLDEDAQLRLINIEKAYAPSSEQALVKVDFSAINPADLKHSFMGLYGSVAGYEWIGSVVDVGPTCSFKIGQKLFGMSTPGFERPLYCGAHQDYLITDG